MKMTSIQIKRLLIAAFFTFFLSSMSMAQILRFNGYTSYVFDDKFDSYYSSTDYFNGKIEGGFQWGGGLEYKVDATKGIELKYLRQDALVPMTYYKNGTQTKDFEAGFNYILVGGNNYFPVTNDKIEPYFGAGLGMLVIGVKNPEDSNQGNITKFAWNLKLGTNIWVSDRVGVKLHGEMVSAVQAAYGGFYFGTGGGGAGVTAVSSIYQFSLGGGLVFSLDK